MATAAVRHRSSLQSEKAVQSGGTAIGKLILAQADEEADLLVMGGYGHSRLREMMLGGVTCHMLEHMSVPVLFAH